MKNIKQYIKNIDTYRYLASVFLILVVLILSIDFSNAGSNYDQAIRFRPMCIGLGLLMLVNMDIKKWLNIVSVITAIISYVAFHFGYMWHIVPDICEYKFHNIVRFGTIVGVVWSVVYVSIIVDIIKTKAWTKLKTVNPILMGAFFIYIILVAIFGNKYTEQIFVIFEFLALFYIFLDGKYKNNMIRALEDAILLSFVYVMYQSLMHRPYDTERYQLYFGNSNLAGTYLAGVVIAVFIKITEIWNGRYSKKARCILLVAFYIVMGLACSLVLLNYTRTTIAGLILAFGTALVAEMIHEKKKGQVFLRYILVIASTIALFYVTFILIRYVPAYVDKPVLFINEYNDECKIREGEDFNSKKYTTMGSYLRIVFGKWGILIDFEAMENGEEAEETVVDGRDVTNGRTEVWELFVPQFNLTGHFPRYAIDESGEIIPHAHNSYFQIIYEDGLITGITYIVLFGLLYLCSIVNVVKVCSPQSIMSLLFAACVLVTQCLEWISRPQYILYAMTIFMMVYIVTETKKHSKN